MSVWYSGATRDAIIDGPFDTRDAAVKFGRANYSGSFFVATGEATAVATVPVVANIERIASREIIAASFASRVKLDKLVERFEPDIRSAFQAAMQDIVDRSIVAEITAAVEANDVAGAFRAVGYTDAALRPLTSAIDRAFETAGDTVGETFPKVLETPSGKAVFRFDVRNERAENWLRDKSATLVSRLTDEARTNIRQVVTDGMERGINPRTIALDSVGRVDPATGNRTGGIVGLTTGQEGWVRSARNKLENLDAAYFGMELRDKRFDATVEKAIADKKPLPPATVEKLVARYKDNALKFRGEAIARTEAIQALNQAEYEALKQATETGAITAANVKRVWDSAGDRRVRLSHAAMDGQTVSLDDPFVSPLGSRLMFPGDISLGAAAGEIVNCRCRVRTAVDWLADLD